MFRPFFMSKQWALWAWIGSPMIIASLWYQVQLDKDINEWFGEFYDTFQLALTAPGTVPLDQFIGLCLTFASIAGIYVGVYAVTSFFVSHWVFRWRTAMADRYHSMYDKISHIEGASQRVQEDTLKFARIMEGLGQDIVRSIMVLIVFVPILWGFSAQVDTLPWYSFSTGEWSVINVEHALVWVAVMAALAGTLGLALVGWKLPGIEFDIQKEEAGYRKELVIREDDGSERPVTLEELYGKVRGIHFRSYFHYLYFNVARISYYQGMVIVPYVALAPTIVTATFTLGMIQQIIRAFNKVENSLQLVVNAWPTVVELISVHKRLTAFEREIQK